jgi:hypothetical protein
VVGSTYGTSGKMDLVINGELCLADYVYRILCTQEAQWGKVPISPDSLS